ncbi:MAG TPA: Asp-tRNA(Asn)/Glu-tRNA(Gln) amidotransferase subunit GatC [Nitrosomonas nitrosa]|jgi:aspartyl-tRNA(Asn)/glutamyl-tRNA(Gln) amidotransferase subunit C|uniref:Aspartyl/glutamyl-tRNA(Asn/Gln) amidotransferase subunit C n=1 Tax=Nitrosomonas nitrosa TaxID=52442 RepID=A0A1I4U3G2_9PROT|nr:MULTISPECIES: Asp-tRNA(Asn)/Glu-tRNA(Gln) amidotransferase subunit GatC [Nitrosomonas]MCO6432856.1 Asp-tRNA(Asn)/Glu-tRNA(Gln) amidotransferase subunit GatC [Nitrosomonas nitrosa]MCW5602748.1 Asp-tRNA(Asn)/Glu-tRNA(Gln) amidotransferase subunit GatC [Nitrosomonas sp.]PTQ93686.1 aspartyl/glutamyl-tRNA(Asn/Gln) amidotransferase subunit C [Nitrosomonas nitrosa]CAE6518804.1 Aspartyl/glutamyl-tRNA(Asn/Gln) amidotransferase subunit C [Nitrosomonas nitrosa]SFM83552.1 aspartyl/glutamyl-tRNA(Asn/Gln
MTLSLDDVKRVASLARIEISEDEAQQMLTQLSGIFSLIEQMQAVDTSGIEPMSHAQDMMQRLREDVVTESDQHLLFQSVAPQVEAGLYLVPKVIE